MKFRQTLLKKIGSALVLITSGFKGEHMKYIIVLASLFLTSCMTGSLDQSTLPQTGAAGRIDRTLISGEPKAGLKEISYKRHFTRSVQGRDDTIRVMLFVDPYIKLNAKAQAEDEGKEKGFSPAQIDEEYQRTYINNMKAWVQTKTCFDFEINSNTQEAGDGGSWDVILKSVADGKNHEVEMQFEKDHLVGRGIKWYQFTGIMCTNERVEPALGLQMSLIPKYRKDKVITLKWE
jgi:hypothetical protein